LDGDEPLANIFEKMFEQSEGKSVEVDMKDDDSLREYLFRIFPEHDEDRVYPSDIKKMIKWFNQLLAKGLLEKEENISEDEALDEVTFEEETSKEESVKKGEERKD
jgi:hypothetical protein